MKSLRPVLALLVPLFSACSDSDHGHSSQDPRNVELTFAATFGDTLAACGTPYEGLGTGESTVRLGDARFFLSQIEAKNAAGEWVALAMGNVAPWQHDGVALLDFEDGSAGCSESGTPETNAVVTGTLPAGEYSALRFAVGLPFAKNHLDSATAPEPLNAPGMFWSWQGGYKFARVDLLVEGGAVPRWNVHVGSTECASAGSAVAPGEPCGKPNLATIELDGFEADDHVVRIDLAALVAAAGIHENAASTAPGCMSVPNESADCAPVFSALGLDFETGACEGDCADQSVFAWAHGL
jgi:uncharacterized repeat protein (TIGR04052 family)